MRTPSTPGPLRETLLSWYRRSRRPLPWRLDPTPWRVLLSELLCQQTRIESALPYFEAFIQRFPTPESMAAAEEEEILRMWAGLGYYSRARNLHKAAKAIAARGSFPDSAETLAELPGVGPYTAGAVASIAFGRKSPVVDGNVERVLSRVDGREADPKSKDGKKALWARVTELLPDDQPGDLNQGLMELGATVCTPKNPDCDECPWRVPCVARAEGLVGVLPRTAKKAPPTPKIADAVLLRTERGWLLGRRPPTGLLGGLWEPWLSPMEAPAEVTAGQAAEGDDRWPGHGAALVQRSLRESLGEGAVLDGELGKVVHVFTHRQLTVRVWSALWTPDGPPPDPKASPHYEEMRWVDDLATVGLSTLAQKILAMAAPRDEKPKRRAPLPRPEGFQTELLFLPPHHDAPVSAKPKTIKRRKG